MYLPAHFDEKRLDVLHALVRRHPFGLLVTQTTDGPSANGIPFILDADGAAGLGTLRGHVARANPVWREAATDVPSLVVFQGPDAYVSPSWYPSKAEHGKVVPTWNYVTVQARGPLRAIDDAAWVRAFVSRLTTRHESVQAKPWAVTDAPPDYIETMSRAIIGIEIPLTALTGKWKTSQNRSAADRDGVAAGLRATGHPDAAASVEGTTTPR